MLNGIVTLKVSTQRLLADAKAVVESNETKPLDPVALDLAKALVVSCQNSLAMVDALSEIDRIPSSRSFGINGRSVDGVSRNSIHSALVRLVHSVRTVPVIPEIAEGADRLREASRKASGPDSFGR